jgi:hypothetical protein
VRGLPSSFGVVVGDIVGDIVGVVVGVVVDDDAWRGYQVGVVRAVLLL